MTKKVRVIYIGNAKKAYIELNKLVGKEIEKGIKKSYNQKLLGSLKKSEELLKFNPQYGRHMSKKYLKNKVIQEYEKMLQKYDVDELWELNLYDYWRAIYSFVRGEVEVLALILDFMDHPTYNKKYKVKFKKK